MALYSQSIFLQLTNGPYKLECLTLAFLSNLLLCLQVSQEPISVEYLLGS
jgi:hypothetical protein